MLHSVVVYIGTFHQFDGIMWPEEPLITGAWNTLKGLFGAFKPHHDKDQEKSLNVYLQFYKIMLVTCNVRDISSLSFIVDIFCQLHSPKVHYNNRSHPWPSHGISQVCTCRPHE